MPEYDLMTPQGQMEAALDCALEDRRRAGEYAQMGFTEVAAYLRKNATAAEKWAAKIGRMDQATWEASIRSGG